MKSKIIVKYSKTQPNCQATNVASKYSVQVYKNTDWKDKLNGTFYTFFFFFSTDLMQF